MHDAGVILYLHGFRSSPQSTKARLLAAHCRAHGREQDFLCPQLPASPAEAARLIDGVARAIAPRRFTVIGSSLGGYYATWLAESHDCRVVLLNPATRPDRDLARHLGPQRVYHSEEWIDIKPEFLDELKALWVEPITRPERYLVVAAKGDELLDWREMLARYPRAQHLVLEGSDHGLSDFSEYVGSVLEFANQADQTEQMRQPPPPPGAAR
jgi:predicted esterase YcpF (UPF0227 family)